MIGIILNDNAYEQDIRELLMAFYPGQPFSYQPGAEADFESLSAFRREAAEVSSMSVSMSRGSEAVSVLVLGFLAAEEYW